MRRFHRQVRVHQETGFAVPHHFIDAAHCTADHRCSTSHRFQIDDAKRFIDGGAAENSGVRIKNNGGLARHHFGNPDDAVAMALQDVYKRQQ